MPSTATKLRSWLGSLWPRYGGDGYGLLRVLLPGARRDWEQQAGDTWNSSVPAIAIQWLGDRFSRPTPYVSQIVRKGEYRRLPKSDVINLWNRPNPYYGRRVLEKAIGLSLKVNGNAYVHIARDMNGRGKPAELWWIPHFRVEPTWSPDGDEFIGGYRIQVPGFADVDVPAKDILHFRDGIDPRNERLGMSPVASCLREVCTLNEEAGYTAALLTNSAVPGLMVIPDSPELRPSKEDADRIKGKIADAFTGDGRGSSIVMGGRYKVVPVGFSPEQLALDKLPLGASARVASAFGVPLMAMGLPDPGKTYENVSQALKIGWGCVRSIHEIQADTIRHGLFPEFGLDPDKHVWEYDYSAVEEMQESLDDLHNRTRQDYLAGLITKNEARDVLGHEPDPDGDDYVAVPTGANGRQARGATAPGESGKPADDAKTLTNGDGFVPRWRY
jgi:HK97 family phage portal protein